MKFTDKLQFNGIFEQKIYKLDHHNKLILIEDYIDKNLIVTVGKEKITKLLANDGSNHYISSIAVGTNQTTPTIADTSITDSFIKNITSYSFPSQQSVSFSWVLELTEANGKSIGEYGLICQDSTLFARKTRGVVAKESDILIEGNWTINII